MTPEALAAIAALIKEYGLPLAILGGFLWLLLTGRIVLGRAHDAAIAAADKVTAEWRERWTTERSDRVAAEQALRDFTPAMKELADAVGELAERRVSDG